MTLLWEVLSLYMFYGQEISWKSEIQENCTTKNASIKENCFEDWVVSETQFKIEYFCCLIDLEKCLE